MPTYKTFSIFSTRNKYEKREKNVTWKNILCLVWRKNILCLVRTLNGIGPVKKSSENEYISLKI